MHIGWFVVIVAILGLLIWFVATNPKVSDMGRIMFGCGLLATCLAVVVKMVRLP